MGHSRKRPIIGTTPVGVGATYIIVEREDDTNIQCVANGTVTFTVDSTVQNITYDAAGIAAVNVDNSDGRYIVPASAVWTNQEASGSISVNTIMVNEPIFAIRINITAGVAGSVTYTIQQG